MRHQQNNLPHWTRQSHLICHTLKLIRTYRKKCLSLETMYHATFLADAAKKLQNIGNFILIHFQWLRTLTLECFLNGLQLHLFQHYLRTHILEPTNLFVQLHQLQLSAQSRLHNCLCRQGATNLRNPILQQGTISSKIFYVSAIVAFALCSETKTSKLKLPLDSSRP